MKPEQKAAYINAKVVAMQAEIAGMYSENQQRLQRGESISYTLADFMALRDTYGLGENDITPYCFREDYPMSNKGGGE